MAYWPGSEENDNGCNVSSIEMSERRGKWSQEGKRIGNVRMLKEGVSGKHWRSEVRLSPDIYISLLTLLCSMLEV